MEYVVVGAGRSGAPSARGWPATGTTCCSATPIPSTSRRSTSRGLRIEGPVEQLQVARPGRDARRSAGRAGRASCWRSRRTTPRRAMAAVGAAARGGRLRRLAAERPQRAGDRRRGRAERRVVGAFVNFGADYLAPGAHLARQPRHVPDRRAGRPPQRPGRRAGRATSRTPRRPATCSATCGRSRPTARCCSRRRSATCRSPTRSPTPPTGRCSPSSRARCWTPRPCPPEPFDGFDPADLEGSIERLVEFNRRSAKTHSGIYRDLAVRRRRTEVDAILGPVDRPLVRRTARADPRHRGRPPRVRAGEPRPAGGLRAAGELGSALNAVIPGRRRARPRRVRAAARRPRRRQGQHRHGRRW